MATDADRLLFAALTQFGGGLGSMMNRRRQRRKAEEFASGMFPDVEPQVDPAQMKLIQALSGGIPGPMGAAASAVNQGSAMTGAANRAAAQNAQAAQMRKIFSDPQAAAMLKQGMAQARVAQLMPQGAPKISDMVMPVSDGVMVMDPQTGGLSFKRTKDKDVTKVLKPGDTVWDPDTGEVLFQVPENSKMKSWMTTESRMGQNGIPEERPMIVYENGSKIPVGDFGPTGKSFALTTPVMGAAERRSWNEKIQDTRRSLREFGNIREMFNPDFLTTVGRARSTAAEAMSRFGVLDLFPGEKERYEDKTKFFAAVSDRANRYIKEITGAQMSEKEAQRLLKAIPNVEDDPVGFSQKLNFVIEVSEAALDQYEKIFNQTNSPEAARIASNMIVNSLMDEAGEERQGQDTGMQKDPWEQ